MCHQGNIEVARHIATRKELIRDVYFFFVLVFFFLFFFEKNLSLVELSSRFKMNGDKLYTEIYARTIAGIRTMISPHPHFTC